ncbi:MAG: DUF2087 domain-containing protein [Jatrophihabitans sp.]|uniref:DUF2087 domain-containing protein n=1 Tax=Jatrophihabitans sp. TaxID=1932789 RepID=UPI003F803B66
MVEPPSAAEIEKVLRSYVKDGRLTTMPRAGRKRSIVLDHVAQRFEPGLRYSEVEVNLLLRPLWPDVAALRRYLVDEGMLARADGQYWRMGGSVEIG